MTQGYLQKLRHLSIYTSGLVLMLASLVTLLPLQASAAAPQDTYAWQKNIGTPGCPEQGQPWGVVVAGGKVYQTDEANSAVEIFDTSGNFITKFGSYGSGNGQLSGDLGGVAVDSMGAIYIFDAGNYRVQKFSSAGVYLYQFGSYGTANGQFGWGGDGTGIALDSVGNLFVIDSGNNRIEKFDPSGNYLSQFGSYGTGNGQFNMPEDVAFDAAGNIYVTDSGNDRVEKFSSTGTYLSKFGSSGINNGQFDSPQATALDSGGNIYVSDSSNHRIQKFSSAGTYISQFGSYGSGDSQFGWSIPDIAVDGTGNIYVVDSDDYRIQKFSSNGNYLQQLRYFTDPDSQHLCSPNFSTIGPDGNLYVTDSTWNNVKIYNPSTGVLERVIGLSSQNNTIGHQGIAVDSSGDIYVVDSANNTILKFSSTGTLLTQFGSQGTGNGQFNWPEGIALDDSGNIYVTDYRENRVQKFDANGNYLSQFGTSGTSNGQFYGPKGIALDSAGTIYVTDTGNYRVEKFSPTGTYLLQFGSQGSGDGQFGSSYGSSGLGSVSLGAAGDIYVADIYGDRIEKFDSDGNYLGQFGTVGSGDEQLESPSDVTVSASGTAYVMDRGNSRVSVWGTLPSTPQNITVKPLSATMLRLTWAAPARVGSSPLTSYRVLFRAFGATNWTTAATVSSSTLEYTISNLQPETRYDVQIVAINAAGASTDSEGADDAVATVATLESGQRAGDGELANTGADIWLYALLGVGAVGCGAFLIRKLWA